jgi:hypothetical protein
VQKEVFSSSGVEWSIDGDDLPTIYHAYYKASSVLIAEDSSETLSTMLILVNVADVSYNEWVTPLPSRAILTTNGASRTFLQRCNWIQGKRPEPINALNINLPLTAGKKPTSQC